ncbi:hypothetical protein F2Q68_00008448 [Brassica cretica]|uniref:Uncharacterized protein n=1 Tax=Brassica cretica TaxID=69181 RepID=A0A8S9L1F2_BRACR|nr:hypothetical protein F2Q68_00008448 [Brassica cretica]
MDLHSAAAWILSNQQQTSAQAATILKIIFQVSIYLLWKERNARIFTGISTSAEGLKHSIDRIHLSPLEGEKCKDLHGYIYFSRRSQAQH